MAGGDAIPLKCAHCGLPFARIQQGAVTFIAKHGGSDHINVISLEELSQMVERSNRERLSVER